jgi:integrase
MELNAAVLSKRGRKVIEAEMRLDFERVLQLVDSETVLSMINKISTRFKVYEGVRIGEIQAATDGDLSSWAWISGEDNTADWLTRGRLPDQLGETSHW